MPFTLVKSVISRKISAIYTEHIEAFTLQNPHTTLKSDIRIFVYNPTKLLIY